MLYDKRAASRLIGTLIKHPDLLLETEKYRLRHDLFLDPTHKMVFKTVFNLYHSGVQNITQDEIQQYIAEHKEPFQRFKNNNGDKFLLSALELADKANFSYDYKRVEKFALLRRYKEEGTDISEWHFEGMHDLGAQQAITEKFNNAEPYEIIQHFQYKMAEIESEFTNSQQFKVEKASDNLEQLIKDLEKEPAFGLSAEGKLFTTIVRGLRKTKFYSLSGQSGQGKTRIAVGNACKLAYPIRWDEIEKKWVNNGSSQKTLFITTELTFDEIQTIMLANLSAVPEDRILESKMTDKEKQRVQGAMKIMKHFKNNFILYHMPDPNIEQLKSNIRKLAIQYKIDCLFYDYIHTSPSLVTEFSGSRIREDVALGMMSAALKNIANELDIFVWSGTQLNRQANDAEFLNMSHLRGASSIGDKLDIACAIRKPTEEMRQEISKITKNMKINPTHCIDFFKNRGGKYNDVRLWLTVDLSTARFQEHFVTDSMGDLLAVDPKYVVDSAAQFSQEQIEKIIDYQEEKEETKKTLKISL